MHNALWFAFLFGLGFGLGICLDLLDALREEPEDRA
jgi:hypothetical protein